MFRPDLKHIQNEVFVILKKWGVRFVDIDNSRQVFNYSREERFSVKRKGYSFHIIIRSERDLNTDTWVTKLILRFFITNPHKIELSIKKETIKSRVNHFLGKKDLEVYDDEFDKTFLIESNHKYAYLLIINHSLKNLLLKHKEDFNTLSIFNNEVHYNEKIDASFAYPTTLKVQNLLNICLLIAENINNIQLPNSKI